MRRTSSVRALAGDDGRRRRVRGGHRPPRRHRPRGARPADRCDTATAQELDQFSRSALEDHLADAHATKTKLLILLGTIFALSVGATIMYARRMAAERRATDPDALRVGRPIRRRRVRPPRRVHNDDEIGELAERFNVMADTIASTHLHLDVQAHHDVLTGLVNRAGFMGRLDAAVDPAGPEAGSVSLMFIDLDDFKHVNDDLGHAAGDELLRQVADRLRGAARSTDVVCRLGGDEFAILIGSPTGDDVAVDDRRPDPHRPRAAVLHSRRADPHRSQHRHRVAAERRLQRRLPPARRRHRDVRRQGSGQASLAVVQPARPRPDRRDRARDHPRRPADRRSRPLAHDLTIAWQIARFGRHGDTAGRQGRAGRRSDPRRGTRHRGAARRGRRDRLRHRADEPAPSGRR